MLKFQSAVFNATCYNLWYEDCQAEQVHNCIAPHGELSKKDLKNPRTPSFALSF